MFFATTTCIGVGAVLMCFAPLFPSFYNTTDTVKELATVLIMIAAVYMPMHSFLHAAYFTLRSGGKTIVTFIFDNGYSWGIAVPLAFILSRYTTWSIIVVYAVVMGAEMIKAAVGFVLVKKGIWLQNIVAVD